MSIVEKKTTTNRNYVIDPSQGDQTKPNRNYVDTVVPLLFNANILNVYDQFGKDIQVQS